MENLPHLTRRRFLSTAAAASAAGALIASGQNVASAVPPKEPWQIGIYTRPWANYDYRVALDAMAEAGFKYAALMTGKIPNRTVGFFSSLISAQTAEDDARTIGDEAKKRGLAIAAIYGAWSASDTVEKSIQSIRKLVDNVAAARGQSLLLAGVGKPEEQELYRKAFFECAAYAAEKGILVTIKPHGGYISTGPQCRQWVERVGHKNFAMTYDPGNIFYYSGGKLDPLEDVKTVDGVVRAMCVKDYVPATKPGAPARVDVTPGNGKVNFPALMARLRQGGFTSGALVIECIASGDLKTTLAEAKKAREYVESLVKA